MANFNTATGFFRTVESIFNQIDDWTCPEMEFLDINLTKESTHLLHAIHSSFYWRIWKKTKLISGFKKPYKKSAKQENSSLFMNSIL